MKIAFVRHGAKRKSEVDPELTSFGHEMTLKTGKWLQGQFKSTPRLIATPTNRTIQTAQNIAEVLGIKSDILKQKIPADWKKFQIYVNECLKNNNNLCIILVGHHPTMEMLIAKFDLSIPRHHFSSAVVLEMENKKLNCTQHWIGQADF